MDRTLALLSASLLLLASSASADHIEIGDAPDAVPGQATTGSSPMNFITGSLGVLGDVVDLFRINIFDPASFVAEVIGASFDSQLFLFDTAGNGIASNDDGGTGLLSRLDATTDAPLAGLLAGDYLLGISVFDVDPFVGATEMFPDSCPGFSDTCAPSVGGSLTSWMGPVPFGFDSLPAAYMIALKGVNPVPEPAAGLLFGVGLAASGLAVRQRRQVLA